MDDPVFSRTFSIPAGPLPAPLLFGVRTIVVFRALQLGDLMCAVPALRALRAALPDASITLIGLPWAREFVRRFKAYLDNFIEFPGFPGLPEQQPVTRKIPSFLERVQERHFDLSVQMHGSGSHVNALMALFGARRSVGFRCADAYSPDTKGYVAYPAEGHEILRLLRLVDYLGCPARGSRLEFPLEPEDRASGAALLVEFGLLEEQYVIIHPGGRGPDRRWPAARFSGIGRALIKEGLRVVITGTSEEHALTGRLALALGKGALNLTGRTTLGTLGFLIANARMLIANDTGVSHIAAAFGTPSAIVFTGSDPARWAPLRPDLHLAVDGRNPEAEEAIMRKVMTHPGKRAIPDVA